MMIKAMKVMEVLSLIMNEDLDNELQGNFTALWDEIVNYTYTSVSLY